MSESTKALDAEGRWPDLFALLTTTQREAVLGSLAAGWHEGWQPNREDVADLIDYTRGAMSMDEYQQRSLAQAERAADEPR